MKTLLTTLAIMLCMLTAPQAVYADPCEDAKDAMANGALDQSDVDKACGKVQATTAGKPSAKKEGKKEAVVTLTEEDVIKIVLLILGGIAGIIVLLFFWLHFISFPRKVNKRLLALTAVLKKKGVLDDDALNEIARLVDEQ